DALVALAVVGPGLTRARPAAADPAYRADDVEYLEHHLQAGAAQVDQRLERRDRHRALAEPGEQVERGPHVGLPRERHRAEVVPDRLVLLAGEQHDVGSLDRSPRSADLLVVGDG